MVKLLAKLLLMEKSTNARVVSSRVRKFLVNSG